MEYEEMRAMEKTHVCSQCDGELVTIWDMSIDNYNLVCGVNRCHHGYTKRLTQGQLFSRGRVDEDLGPGAQKDLEKAAAAGAPALSRLPEKDLATGAPIPTDKLLDLVQWAGSLGLNSFLGHVCLYFGEPYVTIDGYYYLLRKKRAGIATGSRPLKDEERQTMGLAEGDHAWLAEAWEKGEKLGTTGLGIVTKDEIEGKSTRRPEEFRAPVVHGHPQRMAEKRAEWQLLRKLIPLEESH